MGAEWELVWQCVRCFDPDAARVRLVGEQATVPLNIY